MRAVLINHCHPDTPHICATRFREFADCLAKRGHRIVLLTAPLAGTSEAVSPVSAARLIGEHDFSAPFTLPTPPTERRLLSIMRDTATPRPVRQGIVLWHYLIHGGVFTDWRDGAAGYLPMLAESFKPDIVWSNFGNTDCWNIARSLSGEAKCPWVADIKDFWSTFIAAPLRQTLARRYSDAAARTCLSDTHGEDAAHWFGGGIQTIYSGVPPDYLSGGETAPNPTLSLTGAVYDRARLVEIKNAIKSWLQALPRENTRDFEFIYCGNDSGIVDETFSELSQFCRITVNGYVPIDQLGKIQNRAFANLYVKSERTFHHKVIELLAAGRPVICYPEEGPEAQKLAEQFGANFHSCGNTDEIITALDQSLKHYPQSNFDPDRGAAFTWDAQAERLEALILQTIARRK